MIVGGVVPKLLLLLHQLGRHVIRGCSEPLDDCLGFPPEALGISEKGKSQVDPIFAVDPLLCRSSVASFISPLSAWTYAIGRNSVLRQVSVLSPTLGGDDRTELQQKVQDILDRRPRLWRD